MNVQMVAADITKKIAFGRIKVVQIYGYNNQTSDRYIQFHRGPTIAASDVPYVKSLWAAASTAFSWTFATGLELPDLMVGISSSEVNYTAAGAGTGVDMTLVVESDFLYDDSPATTVAGDLTSGVANLQVWASADGFKGLLRLDVKNNSGTTRYIVIQASDAAASNDQKAPVTKILDGETKNLFFGKRPGLVPYRKNDATEHKGCTVRIAASIAAGGAFSFDTNTDYNIRAIYEDI